MFYAFLMSQILLHVLMCFVQTKLYVQIFSAELMCLTCQSFILIMFSQYYINLSSFMFYVGWPNVDGAFKLGACTIDSMNLEIHASNW